MDKIKLKNDKYRRARGGESNLLDVYCQNCSTHLIKYQKDGRGNLLRCYFNRIMFPENLKNLDYKFKDSNLKEMPNLECPSCEYVIGTPMTYRDGRLAYKLRKGFYKKEKAKNETK
jgi:hypothetical protein